MISKNPLERSNNIESDPDKARKFEERTARMQSLTLDTGMETSLISRIGRLENDRSTNWTVQEFRERISSMEKDLRHVRVDRLNEIVRTINTHEQKIASLRREAMLIPKRDSYRVAPSNCRICNKRPEEIISWKEMYVSKNGKKYLAVICVECQKAMG